MEISPSSSDLNDEHYRFGGRPPLATLFSLLFGPLLSQLTKSIYNLVDSLWISKSNGVFGLGVLSSVFMFDYITFSFGQWIIISVSTQLSHLFGSNGEKHAPRVVVDMIRLNVILGILIACVLVPLVKPVARWLTNDEAVVREAFRYMLPLLLFMFSDLMYQLCIGILQGEGRTWASGTIQIITTVLNMLLLEPLFLLYYKTGIWGAALATVITEFLPWAILLPIILKGKLTLKFEAKMFIQPFSKHTYTALKVGFASFILHLSSALPEFALQKYMTLCAIEIKELGPILALWDTYARFYEMGLAVMYAFEGSYLPAASYAYGRKHYSRLMKLSYHTLWITFVWCITFSAVMCFLPKQIASLWNSDSRFVYWAGELFPIGFVTLFLWPLSSLPITFLEAGNFAGRASLLSAIVTLIPLPLISTIIYFFILRSPRNPRIMFSTYIFSDIVKTIISVIIVTWPFKIFRKAKDFESIPCHPTDDEDELVTQSPVDKYT